MGEQNSHHIYDIILYMNSSQNNKPTTKTDKSYTITKIIVLILLVPLILYLGTIILGWLALLLSAIFH